MKRSDKAVIIDQLRAKGQDASLAVVTDFKGMPVGEMTRLRVVLRENGGELIIVKNTLARIAFTDGTHDVVSAKFKENCAVVLAYADPVGVAKAVVEFAKKSKTLEIRHGSLEGNLLSTAQLEALAKLPSREELLARTLGTMNAVPTNFVSLFANVIRGALYALKAIEEKKASAA